MGKQFVRTTSSEHACCMARAPKGTSMFARHAVVVATLRTTVIRDNTGLRLLAAQDPTRGVTCILHVVPDRLSYWVSSMVWRL